ncbi:lipopolysaccharide assembly protein LapB [Caldichromatium japonicum]|uniref:Lipopolysaccharide assembly protein B n=1 Tax=Caldichromatium japonicum TaxID=2699430 RepID=A0A6G7VEX3_9GAMM|nr:lipopolysaccharide assembly protein LapB [Caldichromatium japonicum]QIK38502.1 lipopolysaccharide assembly protein LapB [Caldichromatium japonicum]
MIEVLFLLLPVAAASGWWLGQREWRRRGVNTVSAHPDFLRGLNYLLAEQPDKAIDLFVRLTEVDRETAETHLALGSLFRRRGELDRAIRIHASLIERPQLSPDLRALALFELGQDYLGAGLLDRAEALFQELVRLDLQTERALEALREIYQRERDWPRCLEVAEQLAGLTGMQRPAEVAHYYCELAEDARRRGDLPKARAQIDLALASDPDCMRVLVLAGQMALAEGEAKRALELFRRVAAHGPTYAPEVLPDLIQAMESCGEDVIAELGLLVAGRAHPPLVLALSERIEQTQGASAALDLLADYLAHWADLAVLERFLALRARAAGPDGRTRRYAEVALGVARHLRQHQPIYHCERCGFQARTLHWQCPSCRCWGTIAAILPEPIEQIPAQSP